MSDGGGGMGGWGELVKVREEMRTRNTREIAKSPELERKQTDRQRGNARYRRRAIPDCCSEPFLSEPNDKTSHFDVSGARLSQEKNQLRYTTTSAAETRTGRNKQRRGEERRGEELKQDDEETSRGGWNKLAIS